MRITVCEGDKIANVDLNEDCPVENLVALAMIDLQNEHHDRAKVSLSKDGKDILDGGRSRTLVECGLVDGDLLLYRCAPAVTIYPPGTAPTAAAAAPPPDHWAAREDPLDAQRRRLAELVGQGLGQIDNRRLMSEAEKEEEMCRDLYGKMNRQRTLDQIYNAWRPLHDVFVNNPQDYDGFRREYALYLADCKRISEEIVHNPNSAIAQAYRAEDAAAQRRQDRNPNSAIAQAYRAEDAAAQRRQGRFEVDEGALAELVGMGFIREDAETALRNASNDVPAAITLLFDQAEKDAADIAAAERAAAAPAADAADAAATAAPEAAAPPAAATPAPAATEGAGEGAEGEKKMEE